MDGRGGREREGGIGVEIGIARRRDRGGEVKVWGQEWR